MFLVFYKFCKVKIPRAAEGFTGEKGGLSEPSENVGSAGNDPSLLPDKLVASGCDECR